MTTITPDTKLADIIVARPVLASTMEKLGLDYCCGGQRSISEAAAALGLDPHTTIEILEAIPESMNADETTSVHDDWTGMSLTEMVDRLEVTHHAYLKEALPRLTELSSKVAEVHGDNHHELIDVDRLTKAIRADLEPHMMKEEQILFPMVRQLDEATSAPDFHCGTLRNPISVMMMEHDQVGDLLQKIRTATSAYSLPDDACASYRALYEGLAELESDTHMHVHRENNIVFPAVIQAEASQRS